jgi:iron complex outermembrane recepter protein
MHRTLSPLGALISRVCSPPRWAAQEEPSDTVAIPIAPVTVTVLRTPLEIGRAPYAVAANDESASSRGTAGARAGRGAAGDPRACRWTTASTSRSVRRISVRGFGARAQFGVRGVRVLVDGIPATLPDGQTALSHVDLSTVRRAEVVRGPASALYGNTAGGVIQLETERPPEVRLGQEGRGERLARPAAPSELHRRKQRAAPLPAQPLPPGVRTASATSARAGTPTRGAVRAFDRAGPVRVVFSAVDSDAENPGSLSLALLEEDRSQAFANNSASAPARRRARGRRARHGRDD